ncbi:hypothetical protein D3C87_1480590 [compost metagenome]
MAALSDKRLVWSATLVIVVTTWVILPAFSFRMASLAFTEPAAPTTLRIVSSMRASPTCPLPASDAVCSAALDTSVMVRTSSRDVAEISREVAPISVVVAATSDAVACCCLDVAAISVTDVATCTAERWVLPTSPVSSSTMPLKPVSMALNSSLRAKAKRRVRSPLPVDSRVLTMSRMGLPMARISITPHTIAAAIARPSDNNMPYSAASTAFLMLTAASSACFLFSTTILARMSRPR